MVYIAIVSGIYRHGVLGAFSSFERAQSAAQEFFANERDDYHDVKIVAMPLDVTGAEENVSLLRPPGTEVE